MIFRTVSPAACLGINAADFVQALVDLGGALEDIAAVQAAANPEPGTVLNRDLPASARTAYVLVDCSGAQLDYALNEIPRAAVVLPTGLTGTGPQTTTTIANILREYPFDTLRVRAKVYVRAETTSAAGAVEGNDGFPFPDEVVMAFEGYVAGTGNAAQGGVRVYLTHVLSALADSSSVSSAIAPATAGNLSFHATHSPFTTNPNTTGAGLVQLQSAYGAVLQAIGGSASERTDLWGYWVPAQLTDALSDPGGSKKGFDQIGIHRYLYNIAQQNLFNWSAVNITTGSTCANQGTGNGGGMVGLEHLEPFAGYDVKDPTDAETQRVYGGPYPGRSTDALAGSWSYLTGEINGFDGSTYYKPSDPTTRKSLLKNSDSYYEVGYRYGIPVAFRAGDVPPGAGCGAALAQHLPHTLEELGPQTLWDVLVGQFLPPLLLALAPMADRGLVVPLHPTPDNDWALIAADDLDGYEENYEAASPVRGTVLLGRRTDVAGLVTAGNDPSQFGAGAATYDACTPGQFQFFRAPEWLTAYTASSWLYGGATGAGPQRSASLPDTKQGAKDAVALVNGLRDGVAGFRPQAPAAPTNEALAAGYRLAKSLTAQARLTPRTVHLSTFPRFDIGPGSAVMIEVPTDRAADRPYLDNTFGMVRGLVMRVSTVIESESRTARTTMTVGYVRTFGAAGGDNSPVVDSPHPVWKTSWYGCPVADTQWVRDRLGNNSTLQGT